MSHCHYIQQGSIFERYSYEASIKSMLYLVWWFKTQLETKKKGLNHIQRKVYLAVSGEIATSSEREMATKNVYAPDHYVI